MFILIGALATFYLAVAGFIYVGKLIAKLVNIEVEE